MLYRLEIENYYSIRQPQVVDLRLASNVPDRSDRWKPLFPGSSERIPLVISFFGPNASGKSTVLRALSFLTWFAQNSFQLAPQAPIPCEPFADAEAQEQPVRLAIEFSFPLDPTLQNMNVSSGWGTWRYELSLIATNERLVVQSESLRQRAQDKGKWGRVFDRKGTAVQAGRMFGLAGYSKVVDKVRDNASLISTLAQFDHQLSLRLRDAASTVTGNSFRDGAEISSDPGAWVAAGYSSIDWLLNALNKDIQRIDLGIRRMGIQNTPTGPIPVFEHEGLPKPMPWNLESHGTRNFIMYFPLLAHVLNDGGVAVVDEIDVSIHPLVLPEIVRWFHDPERNPKRAQLWMSSHAASLLEDLEKEEIFFCEKDSRGRTSIYGLQDIQNVRRTDNRYRKYLSGVYGAVPRLG
jgi:hypothetical protein